MLNRRRFAGDPEADSRAPAPGALALGRLRAPRSLSSWVSGSWDLVAVASILAGSIIRFIWGLLIHPPVDFLYSDMAGYVERAQRLAVGGELVRADAFFPPGTHVLLAVPMKLFGAGDAGLWAGAALWLVLSSLIPLFAWWFARELLSPAAAALTAALCAAWPLYVTYGAFFTSETPSLALMLAALWVGYRASRQSGSLAWSLGLLAGVLAGAAIACRTQWILNLAVLAMPLAWRFRRQTLLVLGSIAVGAAATLGGVVLHNSVAAGKPTVLSENSGLNFWMGHCDVHDVRTVDPQRNVSLAFGNPVWAQLGRGGTYYFEGPMAWDQSFFYSLGLECIRDDGLGHAGILARSLVDMTATTVPWPQVNDENGQRGVVQASNEAYSYLLPVIVFGSLLLVRRRRAFGGQSSSELVMLAHLLCVVLVALVFFGDPRIRSTYDVFGLALMAALIADWFGLDGPRPGGRRGGEDHPTTRTSPADG